MTVIGDIGDRTLDLNDQLVYSKDCVVGDTGKVPLKYLVVEGYEPMTSGWTVHMASVTRLWALRHSVRVPKVT